MLKSLRVLGPLGSKLHHYTVYGKETLELGALEERKSELLDLRRYIKHVHPKRYEYDIINFKVFEDPRYLKLMADLDE